MLPVSISDRVYVFCTRLIIQESCVYEFISNTSFTTVFGQIQTNSLDADHEFTSSAPSELGALLKKLLE